jgi:hypothetical protein
MLAKLLKLFPLDALLRAAAQLLMDNKAHLVTAVLSLIAQAEASIAGGGAKFAWVRTRVGPLLHGKAGWVVDSAIQLLVAFAKSKTPAVK